MSFVHCTNGTFSVSGQFHSGISQQSDYGLLVFVISRRIPPKNERRTQKCYKLLDIHLSYPVNTMTRICKKLSLPKKAALEAIGMFEMAYGGGTATAHDVFMAMQEIPYILKSDHTPESKMLVVEENMARALTLRWGDYDLAKAVSY